MRRRARALAPQLVGGSRRNLEHSASNTFLSTYRETTQDSGVSTGRNFEDPLSMAAFTKPQQWQRNNPERHRRSSTEDTATPPLDSEENVDKHDSWDTSDSVPQIRHNSTETGEAHSPTNVTESIGVSADNGHDSCGSTCSVGTDYKSLENSYDTCYEMSTSVNRQ